MTTTPDPSSPSETGRCYICGEPGRFTVREEGDDRRYQLCVRDYRIAIGMAELLKANVR